MKLNHHRAGQLLSPYLDGELLPAESAAVQEHLLECAACREVYDRLRATKALLGELPVADPPADFWAAVRAPWASPSAQVRRVWPVPRWLSPARLAWPFLRRPGLGRRIAWGVAAAVVVLALALAPVIKGTLDRLHAAEIGVDLYVREHARQMTTGPLTDRAYVSLVAGDADLVLAGEPARLQETAAP